MADAKFAHNVYFKLKDGSVEACQKLVAGCKTYLSGHDGEVFFAVGVLADTHREVNQRDFDVSLHIYFADRASHDAYQTAPRHHEFINELKDSWDSVRVFDTEC